MLRPAVAATNCARAGKARGLDIGRRRLSLKRPDTGHSARDRSPKVPRAGEAVNEVLEIRVWALSDPNSGSSPRKRGPIVRDDHGSRRWIQICNPVRHVKWHN